MALDNEQDDMPRTISVVMPAYNAEDLLPKVLAPLLHMQKAGEIAEIIVVDDHSSDGSKAVAESFGVSVYQTSQNGGPGLARNLGAEHAKGDILWFIDSDVIVHEGGAPLILEAFQDSSVSAVFGSYDDTPPADNFASQYKNLTHRYYHQRGNKEASTFWSGCGAVRRSDFLRVEGFDVERYAEPSIEDIELGYRLRAHGGRILLLHDLLGTHLKEWTFKSMVMTDIFKRALPWSRLMLEGFGMTDDLNVSKVERYRAGLAGLFFLSFLSLFFSLSLWWVPFVAFGVLLLANIEFFSFMRQNRGLGFALRGFLFHQIYYVYSTLAFVWCSAESRLLKRRRAS